MNHRRAHALIRFGLGRRGAEPVPDDPVAWLADQLDAPDPLLAVPGPDTKAGFAAIRDYIHPPDRPFMLLHEVFQQHQRAALAQAVQTDLPFRERLVWFWSNHFCVSSRRGAWVLGLIGPFIREAIRPHVTGRFSDMLRAVMHHAAMLDYLDNLWSVGPDSEQGRAAGGGLNENLARECLELHTLGVEGGYDEADVRSLALLLTGWTMAPPGDACPGFRFRAENHQPGEKRLMGRDYPHGLAGGEMALIWLATHPSTYRHLATKLARHFIADDPPPHAVARLVGVLAETGGDLFAMSLALPEIAEAWQPLTKYRTPIEFVVAVWRALDLPPDTQPGPAEIAEALGQPLWGAMLPNGWPDTAGPWSSGESSLRRADWAYALAGRLPQADPVRVAENALGPLLSARTRMALQASGSRREALALLLAGAEFSRR